MTVSPKMLPHPEQPHMPCTHAPWWHLIWQKGQLRGLCQWQSWQQSRGGWLGGLWCTSQGAGWKTRNAWWKRSRGGRAGSGRVRALPASLQVMLPPEMRWVPWGKRCSWKIQTCTRVLPWHGVSHRSHEQPHVISPCLLPSEAEACLRRGDHQAGSTATSTALVHHPMPTRQGLCLPHGETSLPVPSGELEPRGMGGGGKGAGKLVLI